MNANDKQQLIDNLDSARLAIKWVVDHESRAHPYDHPYAVLALDHIEVAIDILRLAK